MMKKLLLLLLLVFTSSVFAQQGFNYKAVIYDNNNPVQNQSIDVKFTVFENINSEVYQETQTTTTDSNGIIILSLGEGTVTNGDFSTVNWNMDTFLKVEIDKGAGFQDMGTSQFNYVPLAKYADKAGNTFSGDFNDLDNVPSGLSDGDDDTQLTETQVDNFVTNNGYLTTEIDGSTTNELQTISKVGSTVTLSDGGGSFTDSDTDTQLTETQVDNFVANNGYLTNEVDGSTTNELQTISKVGNTVTLSNGGGSFTDTDTDTQLTETQVDNFVANNGYLTSEVDGDTTNELQSLSVSGNQLSITNGNTVTLPTGSGGDQWGSQVVDTDLTLVGEGTSSNPLGVDANAAIFSAWDKNASDDFDGKFTSLNNIPSGLSDGDDDTQLTETQVDNFIANNGYLTTEIDGSTTNELQTISKVGNTVTLSNGGGSFTDTDTDTQLTETQVDNFVANNGYLTTEVDGSITNELQTISKVGNTVTLSNGGGSFTDTDTDTQLTETQVDNFVANNGYLTSEVDASITNELQTLFITGDQLSISDGNTITLPSGSGGSDQDFLVVGTGVASNNNSDNIYHEGNISIGHDGASNAKIHIENIDSDIDDYENTGIYIFNNNTSTTDKVGVKLAMTAPSGNDTAVIYGIKNAIADNGDSDIYGQHTAIGGVNGNGNHYGSYTSLNGEGSGTHTGSRINMVTNAQGSQIGYDANIMILSATNNQLLYGLKTTISGQGTGAKYAVSNTIDGDAEGYVFGVKNEISNTANGKHYGVYNKMSGTGTNAHYGAYTTISGTGSGQQIGYTTNNYNSGNGNHYGAHNFIYGSGSGEHIGVKNEMSGAGTGNQIGVRNMINNTNGTNQYGVYTTLDATSGNGDRFATRNDLFGAGDGNLYGVRNQVSNSGSGVHSGTYNNIYGSGNGTHYGTRNALSGSGTGVQYANYNLIDNTSNSSQYGNYTIINNNGDGIHYGNYIELSGDGSSVHYGTKIELAGTGDGTKYGIYSKIPTTASGTHYAVYAESEKVGSYAGYFKGDVNITKKLKSNDSGNADMKAYIYGRIIGTDNTIETSASTDGFTVTDGMDGYTTINFDEYMGSGNNYIVMVTLNSLGRVWVTTKTGTSFEVRTKDDQETFKDIDFEFVVYKK